MYSLSRLRKEALSSRARRSIQTQLLVAPFEQGLLVDKNGVHSYGRLVMSQLLSGAGSAFSSLGSQLATQGSVPHQDLALVCALLLLWSSVGGAIGEAVAGQYWGSHMPGNLRKFLPASVSDEEVTSFYDDSEQFSPFHFDCSPYANRPDRLSSHHHQGLRFRFTGSTRSDKSLRVSSNSLHSLSKSAPSLITISIYRTTVYPLWSAALGISFICIIAACFQSLSRLSLSLSLAALSFR